MTELVREIHDDEDRLELGRIVWDEEVEGAVIEWCADEMPLTSDASDDLTFVMEVLRGLMTDVVMAQALNQALLKEGFNGTYH
tara:strand:+ start:365 stop:613 length:249 start_codon:yes stop_codon:yes gene_type:complete